MRRETLSSAALPSPLLWLIKESLASACPADKTIRVWNRHAGSFSLRPRGTFPSRSRSDVRADRGSGDRIRADIT
jgi:hypothetical protein